MKDFTVPCPHCGEPLAINKIYFNFIVNCPHCSKSIYIDNKGGVFTSKPEPVSPLIFTPPSIIATPPVQTAIKKDSHIYKPQFSCFFAHIILSIILAAIGAWVLIANRDAAGGRGGIFLIIGIVLFVRVWVICKTERLEITSNHITYTAFSMSYLERVVKISDIRVFEKRITPFTSVGWLKIATSAPFVYGITFRGLPDCQIQEIKKLIEDKRDELDKR